MNEPVARRLVSSRSLPVMLLVLAGASLDISFGSDELRVGNIVLMICCALSIALAIATGRLRARPRLTSADGLYLAYLLLIAVSGFWAPSPADTMVQFVILSTLWVTSLCMSHEHISTLVRYMVHVAFWVAIAGFIIAPIAPDIAYQPTPVGPRHELRGIFHHQLRYGLFVGLALGMLIIARLNGDLPLILRTRLSFFVFFVVLLTATIMAQARLYSLELALALMLVILLPRAGWARMLLIGTILIGVLVIINVQSTLISDLDESGVDVTLTGRTWIWEKTMAVAQKSPIWGYGYPSFDSNMFDWMWNNYRPAHPHNSFLQAYFETGVIGLVLTILLVVAHMGITLRNAGVDRRYSYSLFIVATTLLGSLTGGNYASKPSAIFVFMLLAIAIDSRRGLAHRYATRVIRAETKELDARGAPA